MRRRDGNHRQSRKNGRQYRRIHQRPDTPESQGTAVTGNMVLTLFFDCGLAILLIATIRYCAKLSVRIKTLQDSRGELAGMIAQFDTATSRAVASVAELQNISKRI